MDPSTTTEFLKKKIDWKFYGWSTTAAITAWNLILLYVGLSGLHAPPLSLWIQSPWICWVNHEISLGDMRFGSSDHTKFKRVLDYWVNFIDHMESKWVMSSFQLKSMPVLLDKFLCWSWLRWLLSWKRAPRLLFYVGLSLNNKHVLKRARLLF